MGNTIMQGLGADDIASLEREIGCRLPADVREKYAESDGFRGPTDCKLLYSYRLADDDQVVRVNRVLKGEQWFPRAYSRFAILGDDGCGSLLCFDPDQNRAILWNPADGEWLQCSLPTMTALWAHIAELYEGVA